MAFFDGIGTALVGGALSLLGGERRNEAQADQAAGANAFSAQQFATRYQTTVADMKAAGLNPMLAYSQGGGSPPAGQQAQMQDTVSPAVATGIAARMNSAQVANIEADTENKKAQADLIEAQALNQRASAAAASTSVGQIQATTQKLIEETKNVPLEGQRLRYVAQQLAESAALMAQQGHTQVEIRNQLTAAVAKMRAETKLLDLDFAAASKLDNMGRELGQLKPFFEILRSVLRPR